MTVPPLRHSFCYSPVGKCTDLRYIQNLLGHENSKTTEIYTPMTTKDFSQITSPIGQTKFIVILFEIRNLKDRFGSQYKNNY